jgi:cell fate regulator YaaT (PSP1 superfamily)
MNDHALMRVRLRHHGPVEVFTCAPDIAAPLGAMCVVSYDRGQDFGQVIAYEDRACATPPEKQRIVRVCLPTDEQRIERIQADARENLKPCQEEINAHKLEMKLVDAEYTFDRSKIVFYFAAEERVDFRQLVRTLAKKFRIRIELRQIGIRDETRILGGIACCGRVTCCRVWLHEFTPVNIRMAKLQQIQLHPSKLSGVCNRLKCCLAYEYENYRETQQELPIKGQRVRTPDGTGDVVDVSLLKQEVTVRFDDGTTATYGSGDVTAVSRSKGRAQARARRKRAERGSAGGGEQGGSGERQRPRPPARATDKGGSGSPPRAT